ncbi:MAG: hypothetical protein JNN07_29035 [Verrucomicrobiales bacterium]|nr:hypothetical protein [Verrucomicrobiales bacterium]
MSQGVNSLSPNHRGERKPRFERSGWFLVAVVGLMLIGFGAALILLTRQQERDLKKQIVSRDAEILNAVARLHLSEVMTESGLEEADETAYFQALLKTSRLKGVVAARLFDERGTFSASFPINVSEGEMDPADIESLTRLKPQSHFQPQVAMEDLFFDAIVSPEQRDKHLPLLEVNIPLPKAADRGIGAMAQFLIEGHTIAREFELLHAGLVRRNLGVFGTGGLLLIVAVGWAFGRLQSVNRTLSARTDRLQRANQELALRAKTAALGSVAAHLVHGMKNPLFGLQAIAQERSQDSPFMPDPDWAVVSSAASRLQDLVNETVTLLSEDPDAVQFELPLAELIEQLRHKVQPIAREARVEFAIEGVVEADLDNRTASLVHLILSNLIHNAIQATPPDHKVALQVSREGSSLTLRVCDQGTGIPEHIQKTLFTPCRSSKSGGTGIGLAISAQLAHHLGAVLQLVQTGPTGSIFALELSPFGSPAQTESQLAEPESAPTARATTGRPGHPSVEDQNPRRRIVPLEVWAMIGICLSVTTQADAQSPRWRWASPAPHGNHVFDSVSDLGLTVQVGDRGQILASSDLVAWEPLSSGTTNSLRSVLFFGERLLVCGERGVFLWADSLNEIRPATNAQPTADWIEGMASSDRELVAVGDNGAVYLSTTGTNWTRQAAGFDAWLTSVTYGRTKGFVAVGEDGFIANSSTGTSWDVQDSGVTNSLYRARFLNGIYYATGTRGMLLWSDDARDWTVIPTGVTNTLFDIAWNGSTFVLVGDGEVLVGSGDSQWVNAFGSGRTSYPPRWTYYNAHWQGQEYLLGGRVGMTVHGFSTNALLSEMNLEWETDTDTVRNWLWEVVRLPNRYVVVGDLGTLMTSEDGFSWSLELPPDTATNAVLLGVGGDTNTLVAVGSKGTLIYSHHTLTNVVYTNLVAVGLDLTNEVVTTNLASTLGIDWVASTSQVTTNDLQGIVRFGQDLIAVGGKGTVVRSSDEGVTWSLLPKAGDAFLSGLTTFSNLLVATGSKGTILTSTNATQWTTRASGTTNWIYRVRRLNDRLFAVGDRGTILTSEDGTRWTPEPSGTTRWLNDITWAESVASPAYYIVGNQGIVLTRTNGGTWKLADSVTQRSLYGVAQNGHGQLVSVGIEGSIVRSQLTLPTVPIQVLGFRPETNRMVFLFSGVTDQRFTLDRSSDISSPTNWWLGPTLEFLDNSGTLLYVENLATNSPPVRYFRARQVR